MNKDSYCLAEVLTAFIYLTGKSPFFKKEKAASKINCLLVYCCYPSDPPKTARWLKLHSRQAVLLRQQFLDYKSKLFGLILCFTRRSSRNGSPC